MQQRERLSSLPFSEKLRWLEAAHHLVLNLAERGVEAGGHARSRAGVVTLTLVRNWTADAKN